MLRVVLRGIVARKFRLFALAFVVFLGVAGISGGYVVTDTINRSFDDIFSESLKGTDVVVGPRTEDQDEFQLPAFPESLLERARQVDGVAAAAGAIFSPGRFVDAEGDAIGNEFAPNFISSLLPPRFETLNYVEGRKPRTLREASLDTQTADRGDLEIGDTLRIAAETSVTEYRIVGLTRLGETSFGGAGIAQLTLPEAQRITDKAGELDQISIAAAEGVSPQALRDRVREAMPREVQVETGTQAADRQSEDIADDLSFFNIILTVASGVLLFVGAFLIFNVFSITIAQRTREIGMLRTIGAKRGQVLRSVVGEALTIGVLASLLGLAGGLLFAEGINALLTSFGIDLPNTGLVFESRTAIVGLTVGVGVTLVSSLVPALRATRIAPMAALREGELPEAGPVRRRVALVGAVLTLALGVVLVVSGLFSEGSAGSAAGLVGGGMVVMLLGVAMISPRLVRPLASIAGWPLQRLRGLTGRLARENAVRKPGRTASTAAALMIGLALVVFITVFGAGLKASVASAIDENFRGDLTLQNTDGFSPIPTRAPEEAATVDGVQTVSTLSFAEGTAREPFSGDLRLSGVDPRTVGEVLELDWKEGSQDTLAQLGPRDIVLDSAKAEDEGVEVGDRVVVRSPLERTVTYTVRGLVEDNADLLADGVTDVASLREAFGTRAPSFAFVKLAEGADAGRVQQAITDRVDRRFPTVEVLNQQELKDQQSQQVDQLVAMFYSLLALAVIVSILGIAITLMLSIHERTRELGLLRTVGMSRRQVRTMVRYEAVITALIGAVLGTLMGVVFAALISAPLSEEGFELAYPVGTLILFLVLAAIAGVLAAIWPARRASRLDVLEALAYE